MRSQAPERTVRDIIQIGALADVGEHIVDRIHREVLTAFDAADRLIFVEVLSEIVDALRHTDEVEQRNAPATPA